MPPRRTPEAETFLKIITKDSIIKDETLRFMAEMRAIQASIKVLSDKVNKEIEDNQKMRGEHMAKMENECKKMEVFKSRIIKELQEVANEVMKMKEGKPGKDADENSVAQKVLGSLSLPDENSIMEKLSKKLPDEKKLKEELMSKIPKETDPMSIIDLIMKLPKGKKLTTKHIDGLDQTISAFRNQLARGYLHGGGLSSATIYTETPTGLINGVNRTYTVLHPIAKVLVYSINGMYIHPNEYTTSAAAITMGTALDASLSGKEFTIIYV